jgi:hypothetical protein
MVPGLASLDAPRGAAPAGVAGAAIAIAAAQARRATNLFGSCAIRLSALLRGVEVYTRK